MAWKHLPCFQPWLTQAIPRCLNVGESITKHVKLPIDSVESGDLMTMLILRGCIELP